MVAQEIGAEKGDSGPVQPWALFVATARICATNWPSQHTLDHPTSDADFGPRRPEQSPSPSLAGRLQRPQTQVFLLGCTSARNC
jgi:hypothetical protein